MAKPQRGMWWGGLNRKNWCGPAAGKFQAISFPTMLVAQAANPPVAGMVFEAISWSPVARFVHAAAGDNSVVDCKIWKYAVTGQKTPLTPLDAVIRKVGALVSTAAGRIVIPERSRKTNHTAGMHFGAKTTGVLVYLTFPIWFSAHDPRGPFG